jgi:5-methylthioadenosine/S-adenosylhomocysteine deaminase
VPVLAGLTAALFSAVTLLVGGHNTVAPRPTLLLQGTIVTMNDRHDVIPNGRVLVRGGVIISIWSGAKPPGLITSDARVVTAGKRGLIFPGLINIHDHPTFDALPLWAPPSSHKQAFAGRPTGREPYDNRYQWNTASPPELQRLVQSPKAALTDADALNLQRQVLLHAEMRDALAGTTTVQGEPNDAANGLVIHNTDGKNFGHARVESWVPRIDTIDAAGPRQRMASGAVDAWFVHLAEGVRDGDRVAGDSTSSRAEFGTLKQLGLLADKTVVIHGTALERADFKEMAAAGAKLVWSPLSNLLLYGRTTQVYDALAEGVNVSLGTDWTPGGSNTLLDELKIADISLRDKRVLGAARGAWTNAALDRELADMVTRNPAKALRWPEVGSIETGKHADLLVLQRPARTPTRKPDSPYRNLIDATQKDVRVVLVDGQPVAGDADAMKAAGAGPLQLLRFHKAVPKRFGLAAADKTLRDSLHALGGDFAYLRQHWNGGRDRAMTNAAFRDQVLAPRFGRVNGRVNLEPIELGPLFTADDHYFFAVVGGQTKAGLANDPKAPYRRYRVNLNQIGPAGNPFAPKQLFNLWYR